MTNVIGAGISLKGIYHDDWQYPFLISGTVTAADIGKAVTQDTTAANTVKLAGAGDPILGRLEVYEDRVAEGIKVATVALKGGVRFPVKSGETVAVGDTVQGAGSGEVKALAVSQDTAAAGGAANIALASHNTRNRVFEVGTGYAIVVLL